MHKLHLHPSHASGSRSASPLIFSRTVDANGQISPPFSHHGSVAASPIPSDSSLTSSSLDLRRSHQSRSSSKESRHNSFSTGSSQASQASLWLQRPRHILSTNDPEQEIKDLCQLNSNLEEKYKILEAQHETLRDAYDALLHALRQSGTLKDQENKQDEPLRREDYPDVRFWTRRDWMDRSEQQSDAMVLDNSGRRGKARASQGINVAMRYVENESGSVVNGHRATEMRRYARLIWVHMANNGGVPLSWGKADVKLSQTYCREMRQRFPELAFCDLDWKADQIATDNYPSWYKNWSESSQKALVKQEKEDPSPVLSDLNSKRLNVPTPDEPAAKKMKVTADISGLANAEVNMNNFQIKNSLTMVDASKLTSIATNFVSTTIPQDLASSINLPPTGLANVEVNTNNFQIKNSLTTVDTSKLTLLATNFISATIPQDPGNPISLDFQTGSHADRDTAVAKACVASDIPISNVIAETGANTATDITMDFPSGLTPVTSDTTATSAMMTIPTANPGNPMSLDFQTGSHADRDTAVRDTAVAKACVASDILISNVIAETGANTATDIIMDFPSRLTPVTSDTTTTLAMMTIPAVPSKMTSTTSVNSATTVSATIAVPSGNILSTIPTSATTIPIPMAVPSGKTSTPNAVPGSSAMTMPITTVAPSTITNAAATFSAMTTSGSSAMTVPNTTVVPSTITTTSNVPAAFTSSTLPPYYGIGTIAAGTVVTKKKQATKKRTTNSNTAKNLCARDWVPAVGGSTEEFDRHWDLLNDEEKNKYIQRSKQLKLVASR